MQRFSYFCLPLVLSMSSHQQGEDQESSRIVGQKKLFLVHTTKLQSIPRYHLSDFYASLSPQSVWGCLSSFLADGLISDTVETKPILWIDVITIVNSIWAIHLIAWKWGRREIYKGWSRCDDLIWGVKRHTICHMKKSSASLWLTTSILASSLPLCGGKFTVAGSKPWYK